MVTKEQQRQLIAKISEAKDLLSGISITTETEAWVQDLNVSLLYIENRLNSLFFKFLNGNNFQYVRDNLNNVFNCLRQISAKNNVNGHVNSLFASLEVIFHHIVFVPFQPSRGGKAMQAASEALSQQFKMTLTEAETSVKIAKDKVREITEKTNEAETRIADVERRFSAAEIGIKGVSEKITNEFDEFLRKQREEVANVIKSQQDSFDVSQKEKRDSYAEFKKEYMVKFKTLFLEKESECKAQIAKLAEQIAQQEVEAQKKLNKIHEILGLVGDAAVRGTSQRYADLAAGKAKRLFWIAFVLMVGVGGVMVYVFRNACFNGVAVGLTEFAFRIGLSLPFFFAAWYCACEAKRQSDVERRYREQEIKLSAIPPYLDSVSVPAKDEKLPARDQAKLDLLRHLITERTETGSDNIVIPKEVCNLLEKILTKISIQSK